MKKKNVTKCVILSIVTLGIYTLFWGTDLIFETDKLNKKNESLFWRIIYSIITGGIYLVYWAWKTGKAINKTSKKTNDDSLVYAILMSLVLITDYSFVLPIFKNVSLTVGIPFIFLLILMGSIQMDINKLIDLKKLK